MRKKKIFKSITLLIMVFALVFATAVGCRRNENEPGPGPGPSDPTAFTVTAVAVGNGIITGIPTTLVEVGSAVTLVATPNMWHNFVGWYENDTRISQDTTFTFSMPARNKSLQARFVVDDDRALDFPDYDFEHNWAPDNWRRVLEPVAALDNMTIDGVFDEEQWEDQETFIFATTRGAFSYSVEITTWFGTQGLFLKAEVYDSVVLYDASRPPYHNTSMFFSISPTRNLTENTLQFRTGANGHQEQWFGVYSYPFPGGRHPAYAFSRGHIPSMSSVNLINNNGDSVAFDYLGSIHPLTNMRGYNVEVFVPWSSFGLATAPEYLLIMPEMNVNQTFGTDRDHMLYPTGADSDDYNMAHDRPDTWATFTNIGYNPAFVVPEFTTEHVARIDGDLSDWTSPLAQAAMQTGNYLSVRNLPGVQVGTFNGNNYLGKGVNYHAFLGDDGLYIGVVADHALFRFGGAGMYPGAQGVFPVGAYTNNSDGRWYSRTHVEMTFNAIDGYGTYRSQVRFASVPRMTADEARQVIGNYGGNGQPAIPMRAYIGINTGEIAYVTVVQNEGPATTRFTTTFEIFIPTARIPGGIRGEGASAHVRMAIGYHGWGDQMIFQRNGINVRAGFWTPFYRYGVGAGASRRHAAEVQKFVYRNGFFATSQAVATHRTIDGDLSDWDVAPGAIGYEAYNINYVELRNYAPRTQYAGRGVTFFAFLADDGLYIAARINVNNIGRNNHNWWQNTNLEFWINGRNQRWANPQYHHRSVITAMQYVDHGAGAAPARFEVTFEIFIPRYLIPVNVWGNGDDSFVRLGMAVQTPGQYMYFFRGAAENPVRSAWWGATINPPLNTAGNAVQYPGWYLHNQFFVYNTGLHTSAR